MQYINLMGQKQASPPKTPRYYDIQSIQSGPPELRQFGTLIHTAKLEKIHDYQFAVNRGKKDNYFIIKTNRIVEDLSEYKGYVEIYYLGNKKIFAGTVDRLKRQGFGVQFNIYDKFVYRGQFINDQYHGWGQTLKYQGQFKEGKKDGWGKWVDLDKYIEFEGYFREDRPHGIGYLNVSVEEVNSFMMSEDYIKEGEKIKYKYVGQWANGKMNGKGKISTRKEIYQGNFVEGLYNGDGVLKSNGVSKEGKFYNGQLLD